MEKVDKFIRDKIGFNADVFLHQENFGSVF